MTETENSHARTEEVDGVITVTFTRDDKRNAISGEMFDAIDSALVTLDDRDDLRVMVIRSEGRFFSAGIDIGFVHAVFPADEFDEAVDAAARKLASMPREALDVAKMAIDAAPLADRRAARDFDRVAQTYLISSPEHHDRVDRFMNR